MTDRYCIENQGRNIHHFAAKDLLNCCIYCGNGCYGGYPSKAFEYAQHDGLAEQGTNGVISFNARFFYNDDLFY